MSQLIIDQQSSRSPPPKRTGIDSCASKHQSTSQLHSDRNRPKSSGHTGTQPSATRHHSTGKSRVSRPDTDQPEPTVATDTGSLPLQRQRQDSFFSLSSGASSEFSD